MAQGIFSVRVSALGSSFPQPQSMFFSAPWLSVTGWVHIALFRLFSDSMYVMANFASGPVLTSCFCRSAWVWSTLENMNLLLYLHTWEQLWVLCPSLHSPLFIRALSHIHLLSSSYAAVLPLLSWVMWTVLFTFF